MSALPWPAKTAETARAVEQYTCGSKIPHASQRIADKRAAERGSVAGRPIYSYRCPCCKQWHLTSQAPGAKKTPRTKTA